MQAVEPRFLAGALAGGVRLRIGLMNKMEHEGVLRDVGRYEINLVADGALITLLKQEISFISAPQSLAGPVAPQTASASAEAAPAQDTAGAKPNIQQEFLDKAIRESQPLTLYLINGLRVKAQLEAYDNFTLLLREGNKRHLYYKHSITTINR